MRWLVAWLALWLLAWPAAWADEGQECIPRIVSSQVARSADGGRPVEGWEPVTLPDRWGRRWPGYSGTACLADCDPKHDDRADDGQGNLPRPWVLVLHALPLHVAPYAHPP